MLGSALPNLVPHFGARPIYEVMNRVVARLRAQKRFDTYTHIHTQCTEASSSSHPRAKTHTHAGRTKNAHAHNKSVIVCGHKQTATHINGRALTRRKRCRSSTRRRLPSEQEPWPNRANLGQYTNANKHTHTHAHMRSSDPSHSGHLIMPPRAWPNVVCLSARPRRWRSYCVGR